MKHRKRIAVSALLAFVGCGAVAWLVLRPRDPMFHGKRESVWIENLSPRDEEHIIRWREFGPDGVHVLVRALEGANRPADRLYRDAYRRMGPLTRYLPSPRMDRTRTTRMKVVDLLSRLRKDAMLATPAMIRALGDENPSVRACAITFFTDTEDENCHLNRLEKADKDKALPYFIRALEDDGDNFALRNNAALALGFYPEHGETLIPVLTSALKDPAPQVRLLAAKALNGVAPDAITNANAVSIVAKILKNPDDQIAHRAAELLGEMRKQPSIAVPALIESVENPHSLVATSAARALAEFPDQADIIVPALVRAHQEGSNLVSQWAGHVLKKLDPAAAAGAGVK